jgi:hypothetical protein
MLGGVTGVQNLFHLGIILEGCGSWKVLDHFWKLGFWKGEGEVGELFRTCLGS